MAQETQEPQGYPTPDAAQQANNDMWRTFKKQFQEKPITYGTILVLFGFFIGAILFHYDPTWNDNGNNLFSYFTNFGTELLGVVFTILVVDKLQEIRNRKQLAKQLLIDVKYGTNEAAINAINRMRGYDDEYGWYKGENGLLVGSDLTKANLENVDLTDANLQNSNLTFANLKRATLINAQLQSTKLYGCILEGAKLSEANLEGAILNEANLENAILVGSSLIRAKLWKTNMCCAVLHDADLRGIEALECNFEKAKLQRTKLQNATMGCANFRGAVLIGANLREANLSECDIQEADLSRTLLVTTYLEDAKLQGTKLSQANLLGAYLNNAILSSNTTLPNGDSYNSENSDQLRRFTDPDYDGPEGFWDPCKEIIGLNKPRYCREEW